MIIKSKKRTINEITRKRERITIMNITNIICENMEEKKKRIKNLSCQKLVISFHYFIDITDKDTSNYTKEKRKTIKIKYFDLDDLYDISKNENIREVEYKFTNDFHGWTTNVVDIIFRSVQPVLSFLFSTTKIKNNNVSCYNFKELEDFVRVNDRCRILKVTGAHFDYRFDSGRYFYSDGLLFKNIGRERKSLNNTLLEIQGLTLGRDDLEILSNNQYFLMKAKKRMLAENVKKVFELQQHYYFPKA